MRKAACFFVVLIGLLGLGCPTTPPSTRRVTPLTITPEPEFDTPPQLAPDIRTNLFAFPPITGSNAVPIVLEKTNSLPGALSAWISWARWAETNSLTKPRLTRSSPGLDYTLDTKRGVLLVKMGTRQAFWDGLNLGLGFVPYVRHGEPFIHSLDAAKNFEPLLSMELKTSKEMGVIVIDPGHGGANSGAKSACQSSFEKEFTLDWARRIERILSASGYRVLLTRTNDCNLSLLERVAFTEQAHAGCFISLHFNSIETETGVHREEGLETYCLTPAGMPSSLTRDYDDDISRVFPNNAFDEQNLQLAIRVHRALIERTGSRDRGVRRARFMTVLREQQRPAILIEGGYLSSPREARLIADANYREKLAEAVALALSQ